MQVAKKFFIDHLEFLPSEYFSPNILVAENKKVLKIYFATLGTLPASAAC